MLDKKKKPKGRRERKRVKHEPRKKNESKNVENPVIRFCPKCKRPTDKRNAVLGVYANPKTCTKEGCPLIVQNPNVINVSGKMVTLPNGPCIITNGKVIKGRQYVKLQKNKLWLEKQKLKGVLFECPLCKPGTMEQSRKTKPIEKSHISYECNACNVLTILDSSKRVWVTGKKESSVMAIEVIKG